MKYLSLVFLFLNLQIVLAQSFTSQELAIIRSGDSTSALTVYQSDVDYQRETLLRTSIDVENFDEDTSILVSRMKSSLLGSRGVGIAAPQVGINRNVIWVQRFDKPNQPFEYFINPKIVWRSEVLDLGVEGDLSIANFGGQFYRSRVVQIGYQDLQGVAHTELVEGFTAVIFQHEIDHLFGILISDKIKEQSLKTYQPKSFYLETKK